MPPTAGRRSSPSYTYGPPRRHGARRLLVLILILATIGAGGYLYLNRGSSSSGSTTDFVQVDQRFIADAYAIPGAARQVHRFAELHAFDQSAIFAMAAMAQEFGHLQAIAGDASGNQKAIADQAVTTAQQALDAVGQYHKAIAFTYRLIDADTAAHDLSTAIASLKHQITAWRHA
jgi:hypothetical protein